jgi:ribonuclease VapC
MEQITQGRRHPTYVSHFTARPGRISRPALARFLQENSVQTVAFDEAHASMALDAYSRFGQGRHPAALNFGDCCTYAVASLSGLGGDFAQTDLRLVGLDPPDAADPNQ